MSPTVTNCPQCGVAVVHGFALCSSCGASLDERDSPDRDSLIGAVCGDYRIQERIGVGGMGIVYRAVQPAIGKAVAIKVLRAAYQGPEAQRMLTEARAAAAVSHRGLVNVFGFGQTPDGRPFLAMELLSGESLEALLKRQPRISASETIAILDEALDALSAAHAAGVVHRDVKPSNIHLVALPDGGRYVKLLDFGLAKQSDSRGEQWETQSSRIVGTPRYMAPEQAMGAAVGPRTDLYSLAIVAFEMLTGQRPFDGTPAQLIASHVHDEPTALRAIEPSVPVELEAIVLRLLKKRPDERPRSAQDVRRMLAKLRPRASPTLIPRPAASKWSDAAEGTAVTEEISGRSAITQTLGSEPAAPSDASQTARHPRRLRFGPVAIAALVVVGVGLGAFFAWGRLSSGWVDAAPNGKVELANEALMARIDALEDRLAAVKGDLSVAEAQRDLEAFRSRARAARSDADRQALEVELSAWARGHLPSGP